MDRAFHRGEGLPPVSLYEVGDYYFVLDGHHRVSVAHYHGVEWIDAQVTEFGAGSGLWSELRDLDALIEPSKRGELRMREMTSLELAKQRREELLREAELRRRAKALRATRRRRAGQRSALAWETKRQAGRLLKFLRTLRKAG